MLVGKPDGEKFASFYAYIKMMKIYDKNGNMLKELLMEQPTDVTNDESRFAYYSTFPYATDQYIYVLANELGGRKYLQIYAISNDRDNVIYTYELYDIFWSIADY